MLAPFMTVGSSPAWARMVPIMPVVVDLPLVPATPTRSPAALNNSESSSGRVTIVAPTRRAACTSGTLSSMAAETTRIWSGEVRPLPSCGNSVKPPASSAANFSGVRPWSRDRSDPATTAPRAFTMVASGFIPLPPMPQKK